MMRLGDDDRYTVRDWIGLLLCVVFVFAVIGGMRIAVVIGPSMQPTLADHSIHITVPDHEPEIGDIVTFKHGGVLLIKRVVAGPGDVVDHWGETLRLGPGQYYVLGDNHNNSRDSRSFGPIAADDITGKLIILRRW